MVFWNVTSSSVVDRYQTFQRNILPPYSGYVISGLYQLMFTGEIDAVILKEFEIKRSCKQHDKGRALEGSWVLLSLSRLSILTENFLGFSQYS
jgi:hypothetical protein